jgi:hypothetical protein
MRNESLREMINAVLLGMKWRTRCQLPDIELATDDGESAKNTRPRFESSLEALSNCAGERR